MAADTFEQLHQQHNALWDILTEINDGFLDGQLDDNGLQVITATLVLNGWHHD
ncbi:hypothetical protein [Bifidobacterium tissieri]|uniref:hypothetical protein n=1 Tax=Bifidobacterium tissieri TaxID=1630162 RepID=UPI00168A5FAA|nr:hypothetical protein [Bifidobacterium tissieri]